MNTTIRYILNRSFTILITMSFLQLASAQATHFYVKYQNDQAHHNLQNVAGVSSAENVSAKKPKAEIITLDVSSSAHATGLMAAKAQAQPLHISEIDAIKAAYEYKKQYNLAHPGHKIAYILPTNIKAQPI